MNTIEVFDGAYAFLSNFYPAPIVYEGVRYPSTENAYQAQKCKNILDRIQFTDVSPGKAKRLGAKVVKRDDWDQIKDSVMLTCIRIKFTSHPDLALRLIQTGEAPLIEGNTWKDRYWGVYEGRGANKLGLILQQVREEIRSQIVDMHQFRYESRMKPDVYSVNRG